MNLNIEDIELSLEALRDDTMCDISNAENWETDTFEVEELRCMVSKVSMAISLLNNLDPKGINDNIKRNNTIFAKPGELL